MFNRTVKATLAVAIFGFAATAAQAAIVVSVGGMNLANNGQISNSCIVGCTTINFNSTAIGALPAGYAGNGQVVNGTLPGSWAQPTSPGSPNNTNYLVVPGQGSSGVLNITGVVGNYFGFWAGSIDEFNSISFLRNGVLLGTILGATLRDLPNPDLITGNQQQAAYFNLLFTAGDFYDQVRLSSTGIAFETDNHTFGVVNIPVPGAAALLLSGLFGMVFASRRQKKAVQIA